MESGASHAPMSGCCPGGTGISGVTAMAGYWRVPNTTSFVPCLNPCSCLGSINPSSTCPEAKVHHSEGCNIQKGYQQGSNYVLDVVLGIPGMDVVRAKNAITQ